MRRNKKVQLSNSLESLAKALYSGEIVLTESGFIDIVKDREEEDDDYYGYLEESAILLDEAYEDVEYGEDEEFDYDELDIDYGEFDYDEDEEEQLAEAAAQLLDEEDSWLEEDLDQFGLDVEKELTEDKEVELWMKEYELNAMEQILALADIVLTVARSKCPKATGALANSGKVIRYGAGYAVVFGMGFRFKLDANGNKTKKKAIDYATFVHEIGYHKHLVGQAKYLEDAAIEVINSYEKADNFYFKIDYDQTINLFNGCMILYISMFGDTPGQDIAQIKRGTEQLGREFSAWSIGLESRDTNGKAIQELIQNTFISTRNELSSIVEISDMQDLRNLDVLARAHVADFTKRGSFLKTFYHLFGREPLQ